MTIMTGETAPQRAEPAAVTYHDQPQRLRVEDQHQTIEFDGARIGFASTETAETSRWTEIEIFRTASDKYIVHRVGVSLIYHDAAAVCASGSLTDVSDLRKNDNDPCDRCRPQPVSQLSDGVRVRRETDRHSSDVVKTPQELIKALSLRRTNGSTYLSAVARDALVDAAGHDTAIAALTSTVIRVD